MKKKLIDLTIKEIKDICKQHNGCFDCPIRKLCDHCFDKKPCDFDLRKLSNKEIDL